jgi:multidrug efflux pump subunit AcrA (membrane-fusion protein)
MFEEDTEAAPGQQPVVVRSGSNTLRNVIIAIAAVYMLLSLYFIFEMRSRVASLETSEKAAEESAATHNAAIMSRLGMTEESLKQQTEQLQTKLSATQKQAAQRAAQLAAQQKQAEERLRTESDQKFTAVNSEVGGVKTDLTGAKTDIASTKSDLDATKAKLDKTIGDLGVQSGLIAHTKDELEYLKHKGDRNYYEFTLKKGEKPKPVSTVSLQLKKVDAKKGKFTMNVLADDRTIEKKDRNVMEPIQFYTGRDRNLYELVVFQADKNTVTGYVSAPKTAPVPVVNN